MSLSVFLHRLYYWLYWLPMRLWKRVNDQCKTVGDFSEVYLDGLEFTSESGHSYNPSDFCLFQNILRFLQRNYITYSQMKLFDFGCGKGELVIKTQKMGISKVGGVELSDRLYKICCSNISLLCPLSPNLTVIRSDAKYLTEELDDYNVFYFFNPFPESVLRIVAQNIMASARRKQTRVFVIYQNPLFKDALIKTGFLCIKQFSQPSLLWRDLNCADLFYFDGDPSH